MKLISTIVLIILLTGSAFAQTCMSLFSYGATFEVVRFINQSAVSNAHYWWNFGDGTGANCKHPVHTYPETGRYLVTLFTKDTVGNCSDYYEIWVNVTKYSTDTCAPAMTDSLFTSAGIDYLKIIDLSTNCGGYSISVDAGPAANSPAALWIGIDSSWAPARFLSRLQYFAYDTIIGYQLIREAYKSTPYKFTSSINYDDCSANFEFTVIQEDSAGQRVFFKAMNSNAISYEWTIIGFGFPIHHYGDTMSHYYPFTNNNMWLVALEIQGSTGCQHKLTQQILVRFGVTTVIGIDDPSYQISEVKVFPNPFAQQATLTFDNPKQMEHSLTIITPMGQVVRTIKNITTENVTINKEYLAGGIYFYQLWAENRAVAVGKFIIK